MKKFLLIWFFLFSPTMAAPSIDAESYILMDAETGAVLTEQNADERLPPASLTKIMTIYEVFAALHDGRLAMNEKVRISENAWAAKTVGSKMFLEVGTDVSVRDLIYGVIVQSGNDAAVALAEALAGDESAFAEEMTKTAKNIGLTNSYFKNATGLPAPKHAMSARDIATVIRRTVLDFPEEYKIYAESEFTYNGIRQPNRNGLLDAFPGADGVKTGYTETARYCLASSAMRGERRLIAVVMKTESVKARERESAKLLTYGFKQFKNVRLYRTGDRKELPLWKGESETVRVRPASDGVFTLVRDAAVKAVFAPLAPLVAPLAAGEAAGEIRLLQDGNIVRRTPVVTAEAVAAGSWWKRTYDAIVLFWQGEYSEPAVLSEW